ncbi:putative ergosterol 28 [Podospora australis]|uniref:Ergosterol 28 n=1 Tax=Podospora australis TaxID=1536484 RepID=A0AAN7AH02_9PEZI|nr:putative ergosterol 28 [Podospora australis]
MEQLKALLPSGEKGLLPYYLWFVSIVAMGNALQNYATLHYTRRIYNGRFVPNTAALPPTTAKFNPEDSTNILKPAGPKDGEKSAKDQVTPLAARVFGTYTFMAGIIRFYASYQLENPGMYHMAIWTHVIAAVHFTSEMLVFKTVRFSGPQIFPFLAAYGGTLWMALQYNHYLA